MSDEMGKAAEPRPFDYTVRFKNACCGYYMDILNPGEKGSKVIQSISANNDSQKWKLIYRESDDTFQISPLSNPTAFLSTNSFSGEAGTNVTVWADVAATRWKLIYDEEFSAFRIVSEYGGFQNGVGSKDASNESGAETVLYPRVAGDPYDRWSMELVSTGKEAQL